MTDKRNIVIKVKYPVSGKDAENFTPKMVTVWNIKRILLAASVLVCIVAALIYVFIKDPQENNADKYPEENIPDNAELVINSPQEKVTPPVETSEPEIKNKDISKKIVTKTKAKNKQVNEAAKKNKPTTNTAVKPDVKKTAFKKNTKDREYSKVNHNVSRAVLTYGINNKEPEGEIAKAVNVVGKKPTWVYYFTELKSMNGSRVYHEWLKNGVLDSKKELFISGDAWRTSSRKLLADSEKGNWTVRLIDEHGQLLNEKSFKVD
ncbi:MAG: DUF2914 domain-containing protein [Methylobacter sp.]